jgi:hypothetical protein
MKLSVQDLGMFIGCDIEIYYPDPKWIKDTHPRYILVGVDTKKNSINLESIAGVACWYSIEKQFEYWEYIKPILRSLSDMTEEEMKELYFIVFNRQFIGDNITHRDIGKELERHVLWSGLERLFIYANGDIGADCDLSYYPVHQATVIKWMISKQFDVFGWIEKGLAIDKTKV